MLTIRNVESCRIHLDPAFEEDTVQLIFGFKVDESRVYACSAEEAGGKPVFEVDVTVSELDVELADL